MTVVAAALALLALLQGALAPDLAARADAIAKLVVCACPREDWTRTLESCPDDCADPQKREIRDLLAEGKSNEEVLDWMRAKYGPKAIALAEARSNLLIYTLPFLGLLVGGSYLALRLRSRAAEAREAAPPARPSTPEESSLEREIEEEIARIE